MFSTNLLFLSRTLKGRGWFLLPSPGPSCSPVTRSTPVGDQLSSFSLPEEGSSRLSFAVFESFLVSDRFYIDDLRSSVEKCSPLFRYETGVLDPVIRSKGNSSGPLFVTQSIGTFTT